MCLESSVWKAQYASKTAVYDPGQKDELIRVHGVHREASRWAGFEA